MTTSAVVVADSFCRTRITSMVLTYPRFILPEVNTHCMIAKNSVSSRAVPVSKRIQAVRSGEFFTPRYFGANQSGMQADDPVADDAAGLARAFWRSAAWSSAAVAERMDRECGIHKQLANRVLEPYVYVTTLVTATEWGNWFNLRVHQDAQPEFFDLAFAMAKAMKESTPRELSPDEWHLPFGDKMPEGLSDKDRLLVSVARAARVSYDAHDGKASVEKDLNLVKNLLQAGHMSPFQHQAQAVARIEPIDCSEPLSGYLRREGALWDGTDVWWGQFRWWRMHRKMIYGENRDRLCLNSVLEQGEKVNLKRFGSPIKGEY